MVINLLLRQKMLSNNSRSNRNLLDRPRPVVQHRVDPYFRLLSQFYEPLFLLNVLGQTRGEHTTVHSDLSDERSRRRRLLRNLAYVCNYDKGGSSCTAIGLEDSKPATESG